LDLGDVRFVILPHRHRALQVEFADGRGDLVAVAGNPTEERIIGFRQPLIRSGVDDAGGRAIL
jgi:hypothetical protein